MPKKSSTSRNRNNRQRAKTSKGIEFVTEPTPETEEESAEIEERIATEAEASDSTPETPYPTAEKSVTGSAAERLAARRKNIQKATAKQPVRDIAALMTPEHFAYVRKDLILIAVLAIIMTGAIIALYFVLGHA